MACVCKNWLSFFKILSDYDFLRGDKKRLQRQIKNDVSKCNKASDVKIMESDKWQRFVRTQKDRAEVVAYVEKPKKSECTWVFPIGDVKFIDSKTGCFPLTPKVYSPYTNSPFIKNLCKRGIYRD